MAKKQHRPALATPTDAGILSSSEGRENIPARIVDQVVFDYATLPPDVAEIARTAAENINLRMRSNIIGIGAELRLVKQRLDHGQFVGWLASEFSMTVRTAQRYMAAAELAAKNDTVSLFPPTVLYALAAASTPPKVRDLVVNMALAGGKPTAATVKKLIAEARHDAAAAAKKTAP